MNTEARASPAKGRRSRVEFGVKERLKNTTRQAVTPEPLEHVSADGPTRLDGRHRLTAVPHAARQVLKGLVQA